MKQGLEKLYTVKDVAEAWQYDEKIIRGLIREGKLEASKFGRGYRITKEAMDECRKNALVDGVHDEEV